MSQRKTKTTRPKALPQVTEDAQHYFLRCLIALAWQGGGRLTIPAVCFDADTEGLSVIPIWQNNQLILMLSEQPTKVFVLGSEPMKSQTQLSPTLPLPSLPPEKLATQVDKILQTLEQPRSLVLDDAALVDLEDRQRLNANVRDLNRRAPSHAGA